MAPQNQHEIDHYTPFGSVPLHFEYLNASGRFRLSDGSGKVVFYTPSHAQRRDYLGHGYTQAVRKTLARVFRNPYTSLPGDPECDGAVSILNDPTRPAPVTIEARKEPPACIAQLGCSTPAFCSAQKEHKCPLDRRSAEMAVEDGSRETDVPRPAADKAESPYGVSLMEQMQREETEMRRRYPELFMGPEHLKTDVADVPEKVCDDIHETFRKTDETLRKLFEAPSEFLDAFDGERSVDISHLGLTDAAPTSDGSDMVNHPPHYTSGTIEVIDFIEDQGFGYHRGQVVKYVSRAGRKGDEIEDLKKARWYLDREIKNLEAGR